MIFALCLLQATLLRPAVELEMRAGLTMVDAELDHIRHPWVGAAPVAGVDAVAAGRGYEFYIGRNQQ